MDDMIAGTKHTSDQNGAGLSQASMQAKAQSATAAQMSAFADANQSIEEAAKADNSAETAEKNKDKNAKTDRTEKIDKTDKTSETASAAADHVDATAPADAAVQVNVKAEAVYTPIDIRL